MMKKITSIALILILLSGLVLLTGCKDKKEEKDNKVNEVNNTAEEPATGYFYQKPESFDKCRSIYIEFGKEHIGINPSTKTLVYGVYDADGNEKYNRKGIPLSNFPGLEEYLMSSKVQDKLVEDKNNDDKYSITFTVTGGGARYSSNELDEVFEGLWKVLKVDDTSIYGELSKSSDTFFYTKVETIVDNLEYDILVQEHEKKDGTSAEMYNYIFINSVKGEEYKIKYWDKNETQNSVGDLDKLYVEVEKVKYETIEEASNQQGKENSLKKVKDILDKHITQKYRITYTEIM